MSEVKLLGLEHGPVVFPTVQACVCVCVCDSSPRTVGVLNKHSWSCNSAGFINLSHSVRGAVLRTYYQTAINHQEIKMFGVKADLSQY